MISRRGTRRTYARVCALIVGSALGITSCDLVDVTDPTQLEEADISNATSAELMRRNALSAMYRAIAGSSFLSGLLADEVSVIDIGSPYSAVDVRQVDDAWALQVGAIADGPYSVYAAWHAARHQAAVAQNQLSRFAPEGRRRAHVAQMLTLRALAAVRLAEDFCPGFPLHELRGLSPLYGPSLSAEQVIEHALVRLDSAITLAQDSARILHFAQVVRGRALLATGKFADAAAAVAHVPTSFRLDAEFGLQPGQIPNPMFFGSSLSLVPITVSDREGSNGIAFVAAQDPRVPTEQWTSALSVPLYKTDKYWSIDAPITIAGGIEARLIEAEASLRAGESEWLSILNTLRTDGSQNAAGQYNAGTAGVAGLAPLTDPGTASGRQDLLFTERALWLYGTGHRLGDLRRRVHHYNRSGDEVFPTGVHPTGLAYGVATSIPFAPEWENTYSPSVTGCR